MSDLLPPSLHEKIACLKREVAMRENAYPRWIKNGKMTQDKADYEIRIMRSILADYEEQRNGRKGNAP